MLKIKRNYDELMAVPVGNRWHDTRQQGNRGHDDEFLRNKRCSDIVKENANESDVNSKLHY